jgi:hypothetical protein
VTGDFLAGPLGLGKRSGGEDFNEALLGDDGLCWEEWPTDAVDTDTLAQQLSGRRMESRLSLAEAFPLRETPPALANVTSRGPTRQVFAQYEVFLGGWHRLGTERTQ